MHLEAEQRKAFEEREEKEAKLANKLGLTHSEYKERKKDIKSLWKVMLKKKEI